MSSTKYLQRKIEDSRMQRLLFFLCWIAYFSTYLGRLNYSASLTEMIRAEGFEKGAAGLIGTAFFCAYGIGQLLSGFLGDRLAPQKMILTGILGSGVCNLAMGLSGSLAQMVFIWCANGLLQSLIWSPIIKLFSDWIPVVKQQKFCIHINSSVPIGTFAAYAVTALIIWKAHWRTVFFFSAVCLLAIAAVWFVGIRRIQKEIAEHGVEEAKIKVGTQKAETNSSMWKMVCGSGMLLFCIGLMMQGVLKDGVTTWIPTYIREIFEMESAASIISTTIIPIFNLSGVYLAAFVNQKFFNNEIQTSAAFFTVCAGALVLLRFFGSSSIVIALLLFGIGTTAMMAVNTMLVSVVPIYFAPYGKSSTASGLLNSSAYAGGAISTYGIGVLSEILGWNTTIVIWAALAAAGMAVCLVGKAYWERFTKKR